VRSSCSNEAENRVDKERERGKETLFKVLFDVLKITGQQKSLDVVIVQLIYDDV
jgi:hypothetical protein